MDLFVLIQDAFDGSEICYYQDGTSVDDVISCVSVDGAEDGSKYPGVTVGGYTEGSLAGKNGETRR